MKHNWLTLFAAVAIPLTSSEGWQDLKFSNIKPNKVSFATDGLTVDVEHSSSPLIFPLKEPVSVISFRAELEINGLLNSGTTPFPEDAYLRLGLVAPGGRRLNRMDAVLAPEWINKLFALAPKDGGIDKIHFFNLAATAVGNEREFPESQGLMFEKILAVRNPKNLKVTFQHKLPAPLTTAAVWLSMDGDDTKSTFKIRLKKLVLKTGRKPKSQASEKSE